MRIEPFLTTALMLASSTTAQSLALFGADWPGAQPREDAYVLPQERPWLSDLGLSGTFRRCLAARLTGHVIPDVVMLYGTTPVLAAAPGVHDHAGKLIKNQAQNDLVQDIAVLRGLGLPDGSHPALDALAVVGNNGLRIWRADPDTGQTTLTPVTGTVWQSVVMLATHPDDPDVIFGISASGLICFAERSGTSFVTSTTTHMVAGTPLALACIDWTDDDSAELGVLTTSALSVHTRNDLSNPVATFSGSAASGDLTRVTSMSRTPPESLAWLRPGSVNPSEVAVRGLTTSFEVAIADTNGFVGIAAGDWTGDGDQELVLSTAENVDVTVLMNYAAQQLPTFFSYSGAAGIEVAVASAATRAPNQCAPAVADFDADGDDDVIAPIHPVGEGIPSHTLVDGKFFHRPVETPLVPVAISYDGALLLDFEHDSAAGSTHTQLVLWRVSSAGIIDPVPEAGHQRLFDKTVPMDVVRVAVDLDHIVTSHGDYVIMLRPVRVEGGHVVEVAQASLSRAGFVVDDDGGPPNVQVDPVPVIDPLPPGNGEPPVPGE